MKRVVFAALVFLTMRLVGAEPPGRWCIEYFAVVEGFRQEQDDYLLLRHPEWKERIALVEQYEQADDVLYKYLFAYHLKHDPWILEWRDGDWTLSVAVCDCGEIGSVPTKEFQDLFNRRSDIQGKIEKRYGSEPTADIQEELRHSVTFSKARGRERVTYLHDRFEEIRRCAIIDWPQSPHPMALAVTPAAAATVAPACGRGSS
jgi:hypothetical protein